MSKIVSMSSGAIDPIAVTKRVFWRPTTPGTALQVGDIVCYKLDAVDHKERTVDPTHIGLTKDTYAEGEQEMTGRLFNVEEPLVDNLNVIAGIVKCLGRLAGSDGDFIEIFTIDSGATVPVRVGLAATVAGLTVLAAEADNRTAGDPQSDCDDFGMDTEGSSPTRVIGIAMETIAAAGLCWVRLDGHKFINQGVNDGATKMLQVGVGTTTDLDLAVNKSFLDFKNTDAHSCAWHFRTQLSGVGCDATKGVYRFDVMMNAASYGDMVVGMAVNVDVACTASQTLPTHTRGIDLQLRTQSDPTVTGKVITALNIGLHLRKSSGMEVLTGDPDVLAYFRFNASGEKPTHLFYATSWEAINCSENAAAGTKTYDSNDFVIPIRLTGTTYYIPVWANNAAT